MQAIEQEKLGPLSKNALKWILTTRYNPNQNSPVPNMNPSRSDSSENTHFALKTLLEEKITELMEYKPRKHISIALSGGTDSITVLSLFKQLYPEKKVTAVSFGLGENKYDMQKASEISSRFDVDFDGVVLNNFMENLPAAISVGKEPKLNFYWFCVCQRASHYSDIMLTGDGSDELLAGYVFRYKKFLSKATNTSLKKRILHYLNCHERDWVPDQGQMFHPEMKFKWNEIYDGLASNFDNTMSALDQVLYADYHGKLMYDQAINWNKFYQFLNLKGYSPFLQKSVIRLASHIAPHRLYDPVRNVGKIPLRKILELNNIDLEPAKYGFSPDLDGFWKEHGKKIVNQYLMDKNNTSVIKNKIINYNWILKSLSKIDSLDDSTRKRYITKLLHVVTLEVWARIFLDHSMRGTEKITV